jgi:hypothetical protein
MAIEGGSVKAGLGVCPKKRLTDFLWRRRKKNIKRLIAWLITNIGLTRRHLLLERSKGAKDSHIEASPVEKIKIVVDRCPGYSAFGHQMY